MRRRIRMLMLYPVNKHTKMVPKPRRFQTTVALFWILVTVFCVGQNISAAARDIDYGEAVSILNDAKKKIFQGDIAQAYTLALRSLEAQGDTNSFNFKQYSDLLSEIGLFLSNRSYYEEAKPILEKKVEVIEANYGPNHRSVSEPLRDLANVYLHVGRYSDAEHLLRRRLAINEREYPNSDGTPGGAAIYAANLNMARILSLEGKRDEAQRYFEKAYATLSTLTRWSVFFVNREMPTLMRWWSDHYRREKKYDDAIRAAQKSLEMYEQGGKRAETAWALYSLGFAYWGADRNDDAEKAWHRGHDIMASIYGEDQPNPLAFLSRLANLWGREDRFDEAIAAYRHYLEVKRQEIALQTNVDGGDAEDTVAGRLRGVVLSFTNVAHRAFVAANNGNSLDGLSSSTSGLISETFLALQLPKMSTVSKAMVYATARLGLRDPALEILARSREDMIKRRRFLESTLVAAYGKSAKARNLDAEREMRTEKSSIEAKLKTLDQKLASDYPEYTDLTNPQPLSADETQSLLGPDEALVGYLVGTRFSYVWIVRHDKTTWKRLRIGRSGLNARVRELREELDPQQRFVRSITLTDGAAGSWPRKPPSFDLTKANELYKLAFEPLEEDLAGVKHILLVPDGAFQSLPFGILVSEPPSVQQPSGPLSYAAAMWLAKKYAFTVLPAVSSLKVLRKLAGTSSGKRPFVGFGDPVVGGGAKENRGVDIAEIYRSVIADPQRLRFSFAALPETADELRSLATSLHAGSNSIYLGVRATEHQVKSMDLSNYRVMAFATHGLMAGEFGPGTEPALVLTPPTKATEEDDGLLTASEVAQLKLNADLVILSACNTAAPDGTPGAEGLSGLAKAFFYAGSRALLVSNWSVPSESAADLTTGMLAELAAHPDIGRSEALRRVELKVMTDTAHPRFADPTYWAPFSLVGEGAARL